MLQLMMKNKLVMIYEKSKRTGYQNNSYWPDTKSGKTTTKTNVAKATEFL